MTADDITTAVSPEEDPKYLIKVSSTDPDHQVTAVTISDPEAGTTYTNAGTRRQYRYDGLRWFELTPEPQSATETDDPTNPQPECVTCHGRGTPTVQEAVETLRFEVEAGNLNSEVEAAVAIVLAALEKHHQ